MKILNMSKKKFDSLELLELPNHVFNTEGKIYVLPSKNKWQSEIKLLKKLYNTNGAVFGNKLQTINSLVDNQNAIAIEEIVFPEKLAVIGEQIVGYTMPYIKSTNLKTALLSREISNEEKIDYLKQIGMILEKVKLVRQYSTIKDFYLNDVHESNFIVDENKKIKVVDIDSCKINNNFIFGSKYLTPNGLIKDIPKYKVEETFSCGGYFIPSEDTDLYCYIIMILNFLSGIDINRISLEEFYNYLEYIHSIGITKELIDIFEKVVSNSQNENPYELLDAITPYVCQSDYNVYNYVKRKSLK